jgi:hypothetical protein
MLNGDFGSPMFEGLLTRIEKDGVIVYGRGVGGYFSIPSGMRPFDSLVPAWPIRVPVLNPSEHDR